MTADIVNLRRARKAKARIAREQQAEVSRQKHGRSRAERERDQKQNALEERRLDGARVAADLPDPNTGGPVIDPTGPAR